MPFGFKALIATAAVLVFGFVVWTVWQKPGDAVENLPVQKSPAVPIAKSPSPSTLANDASRPRDTSRPNGAQQPPPAGVIGNINTESRQRPTAPAPSPNGAQPQPTARDAGLPPVRTPAGQTPGGPSGVTTEPPPAGTTTPLQPPPRLPPTNPAPAPAPVDGPLNPPRSAVADPAPAVGTTPAETTTPGLPPIRLPNAADGDTATPPTEPARRPATPAPGGGPSLSEPSQDYQIADGDKLIEIAERFYSDGNLWEAIKIANPGVDENRLFVGKKLRIPSKTEAARLIADQKAGRTAPAPAAAATPPANAERGVKPDAGATPKPADSRAATRTYVVGEGDTLIKIARNVLKNEDRSREIYDMNRDKLDKPDRVLVGMKLKLPEK